MRSLRWNHIPVQVVLVIQLVSIWRHGYNWMSYIESGLFLIGSFIYSWFDVPYFSYIAFMTIKLMISLFIWAVLNLWTLFQEFTSHIFGYNMTQWKTSFSHTYLNQCTTLWFRWRWELGGLFVFALLLWMYTDDYDIVWAPICEFWMIALSTLDTFNHTQKHSNCFTWQIHLVKILKLMIFITSSVLYIVYIAKYIHFYMEVASLMVLICMVSITRYQQCICRFK